MNREETLALYALGVDEWNKWANQRLEERKRLEEAGEWAAKRVAFDILEPQNEATKAWFEKAEANFSTQVNRYSFEKEVNFSGFIFPADTTFEEVTFDEYANFKNTIFEGHANFSNANFNKGASFNAAIFNWSAIFQYTAFSEQAYFGYSKFRKDADFSRAKFLKAAIFCNVKFKKRAEFSKVTFSGPAQFNHTKFNEYAGFYNSKFKEATRCDNTVFRKNVSFSSAKFLAAIGFQNSLFKNGALFNNTTFNQLALFNNAVFKGNTLFNGHTVFNGETKFDNVSFHKNTQFENTKFNGGASFLATVFKQFTNFKDTTFKNEAVFTAIRAESAFSLEGACFEQTVPDFIQAHFEEAPRLDHIELGSTVEPGGLWGSLFTPRSPDIKARYQALKRLAIQAHDHENEQEFWAGELRSDRSLKTQDDKWNIRPVFSAFWWGNIAYGFFSNYGSSIARPLIALITVILLMTGIHLWAQNPSHQTERASTDPKNKIYAIKKETTTPCSPLFSAVHLATRNSFLYLGSDPSKRSVYTQSYTCLYGTKNDQLKTPNIPKCIIIAEFFQTLFSAILIFLLLLGIRNNFKLK